MLKRIKVFILFIFVGIFLITNVSATTWLISQPSAYTKFNESSGSNWDEMTSHVLNYTAVGSPTIIAAKLGNGVNVSYTSSFNSLKSASSSNWTFGTGDLTMCYWANVPPTGGGGSRLITDNFGANGWANQNAWGFYINGAGNLGVTGNAADLGISSGSGLNNGAWHRVCWTRSGTANLLYADAVNIKNFTNGNNFDYTDFIKVNGQGAGGGDTGTLKGIIDDFQIYKGYAFSQGNITTDYNGGAGQEADVAAAPSGPCIYTGSGNFVLPCGCNMTANVALSSGSNLTINGTGFSFITANVTGFTLFNLFGTGSPPSTSTNGYWLSVPSAYWNLNELSGTVGAEFTSGVLNFSDVGSPTIVTGKLGKGKNVTYTSGYNALNTSKSGLYGNWSFGTGDLTVCAWFNVPPTGGGGSRMYIDNFAWNGWADSNSWGFKIVDGAGNLGVTGNGADLGSTSGLGANDGAWHRGCWTRSGSTNSLYADGVNKANFTNSNNFNTLNPIKINGQGAGGGDTTTMKGMVDDIQIFKGYAWSVGNVTTDYNSGTGQEANVTTTTITGSNICSVTVWNGGRISR